MFLPNAAALASSSENFSEKFILAESMIQLMVQRDSLEVMEETAIMSVHGKLMDAVISDSCKYVSTLQISHLLNSISLSYELYANSYQNFWNIK